MIPFSAGHQNIIRQGRRDLDARGPPFHIIIWIK